VTEYFFLSAYRAHRLIDRSIADGATESKSAETRTKTLLSFLAYGTLRTPAPIRNRLFKLLSHRGSNQAAHQFYIIIRSSAKRARLPRRHFLAIFAAGPIGPAGLGPDAEKPHRGKAPLFPRARAKYNLPHPTHPSHPLPPTRPQRA